MVRSGLGLWATCLLVFSLSLYAEPKAFNRRDIASARYRTETHGKLLALAYTVKAQLKNRIFGQEPAIDFVQNQLVQYLESFSERKNEPQAVNLVGLPGIGKTGIINGLIEMGFPIVHFDAQKYISDEFDPFTRDAINRLHEYVSNKKPVILVVEEIDKLPEITKEGEKTRSLIGTLNQILSSGKVSSSYNTLDVSNVMVITTMNISPDFIRDFSVQILHADKDYFDFTMEDIEALDSWLRSEPSATYKILSKTFRNNTVGRLAPITTLMSPLSQEAYRRITQQMVEEAISTITEGNNAKKRVKVSIDPPLLEYIMLKSTYAPSGARETVTRSRLLAEQLINFAIKVRDPNGSDLDRPRLVHLGFDDESAQAVVTITPQKLMRGKVQDMDSFVMKMPYDSTTKMFAIPDHLIQTEHSLKALAKAIKPKAVTEAETFATRFSQAKNDENLVPAYLNRFVVGQQDAVKAIHEDVRRYQGLSGQIPKSPIYRIFAGFPGIGKSELIKRLGEALKIPIIKVNMQRYSAEGDDAVKNFIKDVNGAILANKEVADGKFVLLIEEMDKLFELDPKTGAIQDRPVMGVLKDLMNDGVVSVRGEYETQTLDIRGNLTYFTMNFSIDRFDFSADPRLTSIEDVKAAWRRINSSAMAVKELLGTMFNPDTVSRMMPRFMILKPLEQKDYEKIIEQQVEEVVRTRFLRSDGVNVGKVEVLLTPEYKAYLANESVIPSEGARNTALTARALIASHLEKTLNLLPRGSAYARKPLVIKLHYRPGHTVVVGSVKRQDLPEQSFETFMKEKVSLTFPPMSTSGRMTAERILVAAHEFGHAFSAVRFGLHFEHVVVVSPRPGVGGYVKYRGIGFSAAERIGDIYSTVAARAMERIVLSSDPLSSESTLETTAGAKSDIQQATMALYNFIYELGLDPDGGLIDRNFVVGGGKYASYQDLPPQAAEALGQILRDMENEILREFLDAHPMDWYVDKISKLSQKGSMTEEEFYSLIGYDYPRLVPGLSSLLENTRLKDLFSKKIKAVGKDRDRALQHRAETIERLLDGFKQSLKRRLHSCEDLLNGGGA